MDDLYTVDLILAKYADMAKKHEPMDAEMYLRGAERLQSLLQDEQDKLYVLEKTVAEAKLALLEQGKTAAYAKIAIEASGTFLEARKQKAKVENCIEHVRISKLHARLSQDIYKTN